MKLYSHQQAILDENPQVHGLWWECGLGKTLTAIKLIEQNVGLALVVCPKSLVENWHREIGKWSDKDVGWTVVTKEQFRSSWASLAEMKLEGLIIDEVHFFHGHKSQMHKSMMKYLRRVKPKCLYGLTATPMLASPYSVMALRNLLGKPISWKDFTSRYFYQMRMGRRMIWQPRKDRDHELQHLIRSVGTTRSAKECLDLPDQIFLREDFSLNKIQRSAIKALDDDPTLITPIVKWTAVHQICGGTLKGETLSAQKTPILGVKNKAQNCAESISRVSEYLATEKKIVVVCRYNAELAMLKDYLADKSDFVEVINGAVKNRQEIIDQFEDQTHGALLVNAACSEGYNLRGVGTMIFYSLSFSLKDRVQMIGRIHGSGRGIPGVPSKYIDLVIPGTISEDVYNTISRKEDFQVELYAKSNT